MKFARVPKIRNVLFLFPGFFIFFSWLRPGLWTGINYIIKSSCSRTCFLRKEETFQCSGLRIRRIRIHRKYAEHYCLKIPRNLRKKFNILSISMNCYPYPGTFLTTYFFQDLQKCPVRICIHN
jgi:hypothetical protein